jgi:hypothetical protein
MCGMALCGSVCVPNVVRFSDSAARALSLQHRAAWQLVLGLDVLDCLRCHLLREEGALSLQLRAALQP